MKLLDIIDTQASLYNALGKTGGTAMPDNDKAVDVNGVAVWKKNPPFRKKNGKRINEEQANAEYDPAFAKFGNPEPSKKEGVKNSQGVKIGDSVRVSGKGRPTKKVTVRRVGQESIETIDDEGNRQLRKSNGAAITGNMDFKRVGTGGRGAVQPGVAESANLSGGSSGASEPPMSGPSELEFDLDYVEDEFKGKDTRAAIKKSKAKRETLKQYLSKRTDREVERITAD